MEGERFRRKEGISEENPTVHIVLDKRKQRANARSVVDTTISHYAQKVKKRVLSGLKRMMITAPTLKMMKWRITHPTERK